MRQLTPLFKHCAAAALGAAAAAILGSPLVLFGIICTTAGLYAAWRIHNRTENGETNRDENHHQT